MNMYGFKEVYGIQHNTNCISVSFHCWEIMFQRVYTLIWDTLYIYIYIYFASDIIFHFFCRCNSLNCFHFYTMWHLRKAFILIQIFWKIRIQIFSSFDRVGTLFHTMSYITCLCSSEQFWKWNSSVPEVTAISNFQIFVQ